jgi:hypothetical protein
MATLSASQVAAYARQAGFSGTALDIAVAVARGESGWNPTAKGDVGIQTDKWGPSIGLFQVRCLKAETGTGKPRDCSALLDPAFNARSAFAISKQGKDWSPWTVFTNGTYRKYLGTVTSTTTQFLSPLGNALSFDAVKKLISTQYGAKGAIGGRPHLGIDLAVKAGTPIYAPTAGKVERVYSEKEGGNILILGSSGGLQNVFAHAQKYIVGAGETVKAGQIIGYVGSSGMVTGAHLHWETKINGKPINPLDLFDSTGDGIFDFEGPTLEGLPDVLGWAEGLGNAIGFLLDPANWAALFALLAGGALVIIGGKMVWSAV